MREPNRRNFLAGTVGGAASITGLTGITSATPKYDSFTELAESWKDRHGDLRDAEITDQREFYGGSEMDLEYTFSDGTTKNAVQRVESDELIRRTSNHSFTKPLSEVRRELNSLSEPPGMRISPDRFGVYNTANSIPTVDPGSERAWDEYNYKETNVDDDIPTGKGFAGVMDDFTGRAHTSGAAFVFLSAESLVSRDWKVGYQTDRKEPNMEIEIDYSYDGAMGGVGIMDMKLRVGITNVYTDADNYNFLIEKDSLKVDKFNPSGQDTWRGTIPARPGHRYRAFIQGYTSINALTWSAAVSSLGDESAVYEPGEYSDQFFRIDEVRLRWPGYDSGSGDDGGNNNDGRNNDDDDDDTNEGDDGNNGGSGGGGDCVITRGPICIKTTDE